MDPKCVRHDCTVALLLIDVINDLEFEEGEKLVEYALPMAQNIAQLKLEAKKHGVPCLYVNDNFGQWQSDFKHLVTRCVFQTPLDLLLQNLHARKLIICGLTTDSCVLFTANDAYLRGLEIFVPADCCAALAKRRHSDALGQMRRTLKANTMDSNRIDFERLLQKNSPA
jgi:nicotinamidase-related amidase